MADLISLFLFILAGLVALSVAFCHAIVVTHEGTLSYDVTISNLQPVMGHRLISLLIECHVFTVTL